MAGSAGETVLAGDDPPSAEHPRLQLVDLLRHPGGETQVEGQVEIAISEAAIPGHANLMPAH